MKVRVIYKSDKSVVVIHPAPKSRRLRPIKILEILANDFIVEGVDGKKIKLSKTGVFFGKVIGQAYTYAETEEEWLERVFNKAMQGELKGLPYDDIDSSELPQSREDRDAWEGEKGNGVHINQVKKEQIRKQKKERELIETEKERLAKKSLEEQGLL